jgi:hypothetical protein
VDRLFRIVGGLRHKHAVLGGGGGLLDDFRFSGLLERGATKRDRPGDRVLRL